MNGSNYLLDTNFILGILKSNPAVIEEVSSRSVYTSECFYSVVTRLELLGYHGITADEERLIKEKLAHLLSIEQRN
jgi:predicted nucleic acid-binding protein